MKVSKTFALGNCLSDTIVNAYVQVLQKVCRLQKLKHPWSTFVRDNSHQFWRRKRCRFLSLFSLFWLRLLGLKEKKKAQATPKSTPNVKPFVHKYEQKCRGIMGNSHKNVDANRLHAIRASYRSRTRASERLDVVFDAQLAQCVTIY